MSTIMNVPQLRFSEFSEEWEEKYLGEIYKHLKTGSTPSRLIKDYFKGNNLWITSGELNYGFISDTIEKVSDKAIKDTNLRLYPSGTLFIAITGLEAPGTRGKCAINLIPATTNQSCMAFYEAKEISNNFLFLWYKKYGISLYYKYAQGTKQQSFNNKLVEKFNISFPQEQEQEKIASFLSSVDTKIEQLASKAKLLQEYKKGVMQKIFSQEIRFRKDDGGEYPVWVEKKLGSYGKLINGLTYSPDNIEKTGLLVLRSSNIQDNRISFDDNVYVNLEVSNEALTKENDILICVRNGSKRLIGKSTIIPKNIEKSTHGAFMSIFRSEHNKFISHWFQTPMYYKEVHKNLGATINSINGSNLKQFKTIFPSSTKEQTKIANFLSSIDSKIEQAQKQLDSTKEFKKALLQQMFV